MSWLILRSGLGQLAIGLTLGLLGAWSLTFVLQALLVQTAATDPLTFGTITALLSIVTIVACLIPARRATKLDPLTGAQSRLSAPATPIRRRPPDDCLA